MKKSIAFVVALLSSMSIIFTGCSLPDKDVKEATEYLGDNADAEKSEDTDNASSEKSIVVIDNLFEPILEESKSSTVASTAEASKEEEDKDKDKSTDPVNIVVFGDSQLANGRDDGTDIVTLAAAKVPNSRVYNMALGGTTATVEKSTSDVTPANLHSFSFLGMVYCFAGKSDREETLSSVPTILDTMNSIDPKDVDYYVLSYGTNDFLEGVPFDVDYTALDFDQAHALYNAMTTGINTLKQISPNAHIIVFTPFYGIYVDDSGQYIGDSFVVSNGIGTLAQYADKVGNVIDDTKCYKIDGMYGTHFDLYLDTAGQYLMDNLHLSLTGRQIAARILAHFFNFIEGNEPFPYLDTDYIKIADFDPNENYRADETIMEDNYPDSWDRYIHGEFPLAQPSKWVSEIPEDGN